MKLIACLAVCAAAVVLAPSPAAADAPKHSVNDSMKELTLDCGEGGRVSINGSKNEVVITGACDAVSVNGSMNDVEVDRADRISLNGSGNTLVYRGAWKKKAPKIARRGRNNRVTKE